jgi:acyl-CoA thioesterase
MSGDVLPENGTWLVFLGDCKGMGTQIGMFTKACGRGRSIPEDSRAVLGDLDQFGRDQRIQPEEVGEHFLQFILLHTDIVWFAAVKLGSTAPWEPLCPTNPHYTLMTMHYFQRIRTQGRTANPFFCLMDIDIGEIKPGEATLRMPVRADMHNGENWLQGGMFSALADEAMVLAIYSLLQEEETIATISETTSFMRGARDGVLIARGTVVKKGRRVAFAEADVRHTSPDGPLLSRSAAAYAITRVDA